MSPEPRRRRLGAAIGAVGQLLAAIPGLPLADLRVARHNARLPSRAKNPGRSVWPGFPAPRGRRRSARPHIWISVGRNTGSASSPIRWATSSRNCMSGSIAIRCKRRAAVLDFQPHQIRGHFEPQLTIRSQQQTDQRPRIVQRADRSQTTHRRDRHRAARIFQHRQQHRTCAGDRR